MSRLLDLDAQQKHDLRRHLRTPLLTFVGLLVALAINVTIGWFQPLPQAWILNLGILVAMVATVLLFSMEVIKEPGLIRVYSVIGFCWVAILFTMTLIDYLSR